MPLGAQSLELPKRPSCPAHGAVSRRPEATKPQSTEPTKDLPKNNFVRFHFTTGGFFFCRRRDPSFVMWRARLTNAVSVALLRPIWFDFRSFAETVASRRCY